MGKNPTTVKLYQPFVRFPQRVVWMPRTHRSKSLRVGRLSPAGRDYRACRVLRRAKPPDPSLLQYGLAWPPSGRQTAPVSEFIPHLPRFVRSWRPVRLMTPRVRACPREPSQKPMWDRREIRSRFVGSRSIGMLWPLNRLRHRFRSRGSVPHLDIQFSFVSSLGVYHTASIILSGPSPTGCRCGSVCDLRV